jgi:hypothetical protein
MSKVRKPSASSIFTLKLINPIRNIKFIFKKLLILKKIHIMIFKTVFLFG